MGRLATYNKRRKAAVQREAWMREWIRTGIVVEHPYPGEQLWMTQGTFSDWVDQHGREWNEPTPSMKALLGRVMEALTSDQVTGLASRPTNRPARP